jgi:hypothetical protein
MGDVLRQEVSAIIKARREVWRLIEISPEYAAYRKGVRG